MAWRSELHHHGQTAQAITLVNDHSRISNFRASPKIRQEQLSVVLATYNGERHLAQQLESIRDQTRRPDELVVGDDGSVDRTLEIAMRFKETAPFPVTLVRRDRVGVAPNFLLSLEASQGEFVAFADQDDVWLPEKLERSLEALQHYSADVVLYGVKTVDEDLKRKRSGYRNVRRTRGEERLQGNVWAPAAGNTMLQRRSVPDGCDWAARPVSAWSEQPLNHD
jgi:rhamnosyltransferase